MLVQAYETLMNIEQQKIYDIKYQFYQNRLSYDFFLGGLNFNKLAYPEQTSRKSIFHLRVRFNWRAYLTVVSTVILILLCL